MKDKKALVVGCGGLGCYAVEYLVRMGVGHIVAVDGDVFSESNLNRQLYCTPLTLGRFKAECAAQRAGEIRRDVDLTAVCEYLDENNAEALVSGCDVVIDALDNTDSRRLLLSECKRQGVSLVHGAVGAVSFQVGVLSPEHDFPEVEPLPPKGDDVRSYTPAACAAVQCAEAEKILLGKPSPLSGRLLCADLETGESVTITLGGDTE